MLDTIHWVYHRQKTTLKKRALGVLYLQCLTVNAEFRRDSQIVGPTKENKTAYADNCEILSKDVLSKTNAMPS